MRACRTGHISQERVQSVPSPPPQPWEAAECSGFEQCLTHSECEMSLAISVTEGVCVARGEPIKQPQCFGQR